MNNFQLFLISMLICSTICSRNSLIHAQTLGEEKSPVIDVQKERPIIESIDKQFSEYILEGDSVALAALYAKDGQFGCRKGPEILSALGGWIRSAIKNDARHVTFITKTLNSDGELLIETGVAETRNDKGDLKHTVKYLVVWKRENGTWKLYRDIGL